jgi:hypothetical protein
VCVCVCVCVVACGVCVCVGGGVCGVVGCMSLSVRMCVCVYPPLIPTRTHHTHLTCNVCATCVCVCVCVCPQEMAPMTTTADLSIALKYSQVLDVCVCV